MMFSGTSRSLFSGKYKTHQYSVGRIYIRVYIYRVFNLKVDR